MSNILKAFVNIINNYQTAVNAFTSGNKNNTLDLILKNNDAIKMFYEERK